jgi:hypothetical protein
MRDDMDWEAVWDGLDNEKTWIPEKYRTFNYSEFHPGFPQVVLEL